MKKAIPFLALVLAAGLISFLAGGPADGTAHSSPPSQPGETKPNFTGEFEFHETLKYVSHGVHEIDLRANIPFEISWNDKVGIWAIKGLVKDAKGTSTATAPNGAKCQAALKGKIDIDGLVSGEKLKACLFKLNINQEWEDYVFDCRIPKVPPMQFTESGFTLNHVFDYVTEATPHSKEVQAGIMKGHLYLQLKKFSGTLIDQCGVMY
ncbi:MAG: hypothetical protein WCB96_01205 [Candidatus Aminicenantales bacterium]